MPWTLQLGATTQSLAAWGMSNVQLTLRSMQPSTLTWTRAENFDSTADFTRGDAITLRDPSDVVRYKGIIRALPCDQNGGDEARYFVAEDVFGDLNRRMMLQAWSVLLDASAPDDSSPVHTLFHNGTTARAIGPQVAAILDAAIAAGVSLQYATLPSITATPRPVDLTGATYLEALLATAKHCPDLSSWVDYTTTPPTAHFVRRTAATEHDLDVIETTDALTIEPLHDQRVQGVYLLYERAETNIAGNTAIKFYVDRHPLDAVASDEGVLVAHAKLGASRVGLASAPAPLTQSQYIETETVDASDFDFWAVFWPEIADRTSGTLTEVTTPSGKRIVGGAQPSWTGTASEVIAEATFNGIIDGREYVGKKLVARYNASSLSTGTYSRSGTTGGPATGGSEPGEAIPTGLAQTLYDALNPLQWRGSYKTTASELTDFGIVPGDALNFTGTDNTDLGTARASVQAVIYDIDNATRTLEFGPAPHLSFGDLIDLQRAFRDLWSKPTRAAEITGESGAAEHTVEGAGMGPGGSLVPTFDDVSSHPFKVGHMGGNSYRVAGGQIEGQSLLAVTLDVGSTRPVAILLKPQYALSIYNSQHVYACAVKTGSDAPVLDKSTSVLSDVTTVSEDGDEARVIVAIVATGGVITQYARGNIFGTWADDASLTGKVTIAYDKEA